MNQRLWGRALLAMAMALGAICGCKQRPRAVGKRPTVASLVPSATDLLIGMGAADHLVAVSTVDANRPELRHLPAAGDYQNLDWEQLSQLRPDVMIIFMAPDRVPAALVQKARSLGTRLVNVRMETLDNIFETINILGAELNERSKADAAAKRLSQQLESVRKRVSGLPQVPTLVLSDASARAVGRHNFIDDVLRLAGGENVVKASGWPTLDGEQVRALRPAVAFQLLPDATPQVIEQAQRLWQTLPDMPAVSERRVYILREWWVQQPGLHVGDLAEQFARRLHPAAYGK